MLAGGFRCSKIDILRGLRLEPLITPQDTFSFADSESKEAVDQFDICTVTEVRAVMEMLQVGAKRLKQLVLWPIFLGLPFTRSDLAALQLDRRSA